MIVGIDFGTCFSSVAIMNGLIPVTTCVKDTTGVGIPTLFMYSRSQNKELYGEECLTGEAFRHEEDIVRNMKRIVRENFDNMDKTVISGGREYSVKEIIEKFLAYLISEVKKGAVKSGEFKNTEIEEITITAPVGIAQGQMLATDYNRFIQEAVMKITGLSREHVRILQEPVSAAISYLYGEDVRQHYDKEQKIMVFDLGGGTLDVTIMKHDPRAMTYEILAKDGDLNLGGNDWDLALAEAVKEKTGVGEFSSEDERVAFERSVTKLKIDLTNSNDSMIFFTYDGEDKFTRFSRKEFENASKYLMDRSIGVINSTLESFSEGIGGIDKIVLVGGSCNMPQIREGIVNAFRNFDEESILIYEPSKAIAKGAAVFSKINSSAGKSGRGPKIIDSTTVTYGFESFYNGERPRIYNMIFRDTPFDETGVIRVRSEESFVPLRDDQTNVAFDIYESKSRRGDGPEGEWADFGNGEVQNGLHVTVQVPPEYLGRARGFCMWAELTLDTNGILEIAILDRVGKKLGFASSSTGYDYEAGE